MVRNKFSGLSGYLRLADQYKKLEETNEQLKRTNSLKVRLLSIVAHDTRSPINSLKSVLDLLKKNNLTQTEIELLISNLERQIDQLSHFLDNLLRWTKNRFDQVNVKPRKLDLYPLASETIALLTNAAEIKHVHIISHISEKVMIYADAEMVKLILRNLISNAIKFSDANGQVHVKSKEEEGMMRISVQDTGRGISEEHIKKLFNISHLSTTGTKGEIGTGLGLTLSKEFVEKMHGEIRATSIEGHGSCFEFTVPSFSAPHKSKDKINNQEMSLESNPDQIKSFRLSSLHEDSDRKIYPGFSKKNKAKQ